VNPAVVVLAYDRPTALARLLRSVAEAAYPSGVPVPLVISIDAGGDPEVVRLAKAFPWAHGEKEVLVADEHLGLVAHFHLAGGFAERFEGIVLLEDDLVVSATYYEFSASALRRYQDDDRIAGVSLYALWFNGYNHLPFVPWPDGTDVFFLQVPYQQGQAFTRAQWARYRDWRGSRDPRPSPSDAIHPLFLRFPEEEWFPERIKYLITTGRYYVFPRVSRSSGWGDAGTHFTRPSRWFQVPMQDTRSEHRFVSFDASDAVYDSFFEMMPERLARLAKDEGFADLDLDLYGSKPEHVLTKQRVLTARSCASPLAEFGRLMWPMEANLVHRVPGHDIRMSSGDAVRWGRWADLLVDESLHDYFTRGRRRSWKRALAHGLISRVT